MHGIEDRDPEGIGGGLDVEGLDVVVAKGPCVIDRVVLVEQFRHLSSPSRYFLHFLHRQVRFSYRYRAGSLLS